MLNKMEKLQQMENDPNCKTGVLMDFRHGMEAEIRDITREIVDYKLAMPSSRCPTRTEYKREIVKLENRVARLYGYDMLAQVNQAVRFLNRPIYTVRFVNGEKQ